MSAAQAQHTNHICLFKIPLLQIFLFLDISYKQFPLKI